MSLENSDRNPSGFGHEFLRKYENFLLETGGPGLSPDPASHQRPPTPAEEEALSSQQGESHILSDVGYPADSASVQSLWHNIIYHDVDNNHGDVEEEGGVAANDHHHDVAYTPMPSTSTAHDPAPAHAPATSTANNPTPAPTTDTSGGCPYPGCNKKDTKARHLATHMLKCWVHGCSDGNPAFSSPQEIGNHLMMVHNNDSTRCHWPNCRNANPQRKCHLSLHLRIHNYYLALERQASQAAAAV
ncbi:hypothetical protein SCAR479_06387 [Seiridium cardinale]|uniref:C2H2-type domain-containing protein n=1 Tax=Seiridium cardinale TaxID=138064 RepID=A0ABR2XT42_9PEZI